MSRENETGRRRGHVAANASCSTCAARARTGQKAQLRQRIGQLGEEITGLTAQREAKTKEIALIERELTGVRDLFAKNLIQINRLTQLEREATRLEGERGQHIAATAQAKGKISELELQIIQIDSDLSSEVAREMREVDGKIGEFVERKVTAEDQIKRIDIRVAAGRHRVPVRRAHGRRRDHGRRRHHADRAARPTT